MADKSVIFTLVGKDAASGAIKGVTGSMHGLRGAAGGLTGAISGVGSSLLSLPSLIIGGGVIAGLTAMTKAAADDEVAQARLTTAVKAAVPAWGGNTDALNAAITASQNKGYTDDEARDSLTRLIRSTKDVTEATKLNALAMDLARLKGIPLADAANLIAKAHDGQYAALIKAGISIDKNATSTEALAAIQAMAAGQADTYANSETGGAKRMEIGFAELGESVGSLFLPVMSGAVGLLNDQLIPAFNGIVASVGTWIGSNQRLVGDIGTAVSGTFTSLWTILQTQVLPVVTDLGTKFGAFIAVIVTQVIPVILDLATRVWEGGLGKAMGVVATLAGRVFEAVTKVFTAITSNQDVMNVLKGAADLLGTALGFLADFTLAVFNALGELFTAITSNKDLMAGLELVVKAIWVGLQTMAGWITTAVTEIGKFFGSVAGNKDVMNVLRGVVDAIGTGFQLAWDAIQGFWSVLQQVWDFVQNNPVADVLGGIGDLLGGGGGGKPGGATGGMIVGEDGPETFIPFSNGLLLPNGIGATGGGNVTLSVTVTGPAIFDPLGIAAQQVAAALLPSVKRALAQQNTTF